MTIDQNLYNEILELKTRQDTLKKESEKVDFMLKTKISAVTCEIDGGEFVYGDLKFLQVQRAGTVDYKAAMKDGIDLSDYQRPPSIYWKLSVLKSVDISDWEEAAE